jgi:coenzyme F420-reducing hydrogenase beta subunit
MESDYEGFWYPKVAEEKCIKCGKCIGVCPVLQYSSQNVSKIMEPVAYAAHNLDCTIRIKSSSGGIFTLIAELVLQTGGVVFGACFDDKFHVVHDYVQDVNGLEKLRGSKYVQSRIGDCYTRARSFLKQGRLVLFTGTPCQVSGLKHFLGREYCGGPQCLDKLSQVCKLHSTPFSCIVIR